MDAFAFRGRGDSGVEPEVEDLAHRVIGAMVEVHRHLGPGHPEAAYRLALSHELTLRGIPHETEVPFDVVHKGVVVGRGRVDTLVAGALVLELKSVEALSPAHRAQAGSYLTALKLKLALLANFNVAIMKDGIKRVVHTCQS